MRWLIDGLSDLSTFFNMDGESLLEWKGEVSLKSRDDKLMELKEDKVANLKDDEVLISKDVELLNDDKPLNNNKLPNITDAGGAPLEYLAQTRPKSQRRQARVSSERVLRSATRPQRQQPVEPARTPTSRRKRRRVNLPRPPYLSNPITSSRSEPAGRQGWFPPHLRAGRVCRRFQDKLLLDHNYPSLVKLAHQYLPFTSRDDPLEVALRHGFLPKNIAHENSRFDHAPDSECTLFRDTGSTFCSTDIDMFFESLGVIDHRNRLVPLV